MEIRLPKLSIVSVAATRAVLERAVAAHPAQPAPRLQLARLLFERDEFAAVIALLGQHDWADAAEPALLLSQALLAQGGTDSAERAVTAARRAAELAGDPAQRGAARLAEGRALLRLTDDAAGLECLRNLLADDPGQFGAFRSLTNRLMRLGQAAAVLELTDRLQTAGIDRTRVLGAEMVARAHKGDNAAAHNLSGIDQFVSTSTLAVPPGWASLAQFNAALQAEAEADPDLRHGRHGTASRATLRVDHPHRAGAPAFSALHQAIAAVAAQYIAGLAGDHPWLAAKPERLTMRSWCVMTGTDGFEEWHNHPAGWLSGGYYLAVPQAGSDAGLKAGMLALGLPPKLAGDEAAAAFGEQLVSPYPGLLALFPSHAYHRTYPHGQTGQRICMAFDLSPG